MENSFNLQNCIKNNGLLIIDGNAYTSSANGFLPFAFYSAPILSNGEASRDENDWYQVDMESIDLKTKEKLFAFLA